MKRYLIYLIAVFLVSCTSVQKKNELTISEIDFIEIHKNESGMRNPTYKLNSEQKTDFVKKWNDSKNGMIQKILVYVNIGQITIFKSSLKMG